MRTCSLLLLTLVLFPCLALAQTNATQTDAADPDPAITAVASHWIDLVDQAKYGQSWEQAGPTFRQKISQDKWIETLKQQAKHLGALKTRTLLNQQMMENPQGAPAGLYAFVAYKAEYAKATYTEQVVLRQSSSGSWDVEGYWLR